MIGEQKLVHDGSVTVSASALYFLKTLTEELNIAAIEAKKNAPKRDAMRIAQKPKKSKSKDQVKNKQGLE